MELVEVDVSFVEVGLVDVVDDEDSPPYVEGETRFCRTTSG